MTPIFVAFALLAAMPASAAGDAAKGERLFAQCRACHSLGAGENRIGPHLHGLFGRAAGSVEGYAYSAAMRQSGVVWEQDSLDAHLAQPPKFIPGNKMGAMFARGVPNAQDREDLIAFLRQATAQ
ncbi:MAG: cytochrome c family protein [Inquilinus sp.]|nr:cytochrome c family protein [Inquilinus sp.]